MLQGLISCFQLLHQVVSLSKCCSREYSRCDGKVSSHNRPCPELLPESGPGGGVTMVTMPIHIWLPGPGIIAMVRRVTMREHGTEYWVRPATATLVRYNLSSQGWRGERTLGFLSDLIATYIIGAGPGPATLWHWMLATTWILCIREEFDRGRNLGSEKDLLEQPGGDIFHINSTGGSLVLNPSSFS